MILSPSVYVCDDDDCKQIATAKGLGFHKVLFNRFDPQTAYDELLDETSAALGEMHNLRLRREARKAAPFICSYDTPVQLNPYRRKLLDVFHQHGCLTFLKAIPPKPRSVFKPRFWLSIADECGDAIVDVAFDSMLYYAEVFGVPRKAIYRSDALKSRRGKTTREFITTCDIMKGEDPLTTAEGQALLKQVMADPLTKDAPSYVQENAVRFYLAGLLDDKSKPLTNSQKRAERRMLERRAKTFSGEPLPQEDASDKQSEQPHPAHSDGESPTAPRPLGQDGDDDPGSPLREAVCSQ